MNIGSYTFDEFVEIVRKFHGYPAPGVIIGGFMVEKAKARLPGDTLFEAAVETAWCLPDSVQLLTLCSTGNGWLKVFHLGKYALSFYDKYTGKGVRVYLDVSKLDPYPEIKTWYLKLKPKKEQDSDRLMEEIRNAGDTIYTLTDIAIRPELLAKREKGQIAICPECGEAYPLHDGGICRACQGESPYAYGLSGISKNISAGTAPGLEAVPLEDAVGKKIAHDMTRIEPGVSKGAEFKKGHEITSEDLCRLQQMGRLSVYVEDSVSPGPDWVHEDEVAQKFAGIMAGEGVETSGPPREGKVDIVAAMDGLFLVDVERLERFNLIPDVMAASRHNCSVVAKGTKLAGTRAIPLYISKNIFQNALALLQDAPLFRVVPMRKANVGILVTGTEVFQGLIEDKFERIISSKVRSFSCIVIKTIIVPDEREAVKNGIAALIEAGCDLLVTTAGLSVDPDDLTRQGLIDAGVTDMLYGVPILPGAMTLLGRIDGVQVIGVPACALYFKTTSFDMVLPRLLAGVTITRRGLAKSGHGAFCHNCKTCTYPKCSFGK